MRDLAVPSPFADLIHPDGDIVHLNPLAWDDTKGETPAANIR